MIDEYTLYFLNKKETIKMSSSLIVTGNGFDIKCGLNTRYSDFFKWCEKNILGFCNLKTARDSLFNTQIKIQDAFINNRELTVWDFYFTYISVLDREYWCDIESEINNSIQEGFWDNVLDGVNYFQANGCWNNNDEDWIFAWIINKKFYSNDNWMYQQRDFPANMLRIIEVNEEDFYNNLLKELNVFEQRFAKYISEELESNKYYYDNKFHLIQNLIDSTSRDESFQVLTFNYTPNHPNYDSTNIHGTLESPIFGISNEKNQNNIAHGFTKSKRRMDLNLPILADFIKNKENTLVFYGTSFNNLDHDYYKMLIENYSNQKLYFCYSDFGGQGRKAEQEKNVKELIEKLSLGDFYTLRERGDIRIIKVDFNPLV